LLDIRQLGDVDHGNILIRNRRIVVTLVAAASDRENQPDQPCRAQAEIPSEPCTHRTDLSSFVGVGTSASPAAITARLSAGVRNTVSPFDDSTGRAG